jgi:trk system potassium uptake protein TrkH
MNVDAIILHVKKIFTKVSPIQALVLGYVVIILAGSLLLRLPVSSSTGEPQEFIDALFTATSAVSTTGLVVVDTGQYYSFFGQVILLLLFQVGGLGYMAFVVLMIYALGRKLSLVSAVTLKESLSGVTLGNMKKYLKAVFVFTLLFEGAGACFLAVYWLPHFSVSRSVYLGVFHSVSAFCTSGFSLFSDSFSSYQTDGFIQLVLCTLSIAGGVGFIVLTDLTAYIRKRMRKARPCHVSIHTKLAILVSIMLMGTGAGVIFLSEGNLPLQSRVYMSVFQSISASSTTGFNTTDIGALSITSLFMIIILMFIGASPGGSGGGIKGTAFGLTVLAVWAVLKGTEDVNVFNRRILPDTIWKSFSIALLAALWVAAVTMVLTVTEGQSFLAVLFEVVSAIGTVGLSTGITAGLTSMGKFLIIITMLIGRVGPLAIAFSLMGEPETVSFKYAEEEVFIG